MLVPDLSLQNDFDVDLALWDMENSVDYRIYNSNKSISDYIHHDLDQSLFPHEHSVNDMNDEFNMGPCTGSEARV